MFNLQGIEYVNQTEAGAIIGRSRWGWAYMRGRGEVPPPVIEDGPRVQYWTRELVERVREGLEAGIPSDGLPEWLACQRDLDWIGGEE